MNRYGRHKRLALPRQVFIHFFHRYGKTSIRCNGTEDNTYSAVALRTQDFNRQYLAALENPTHFPSRSSPRPAINCAAIAWVSTSPFAMAFNRSVGRGWRCSSRFIAVSFVVSVGTSNALVPRHSKQIRCHQTARRARPAPSS
jgi:hypothetical protein